MIIQNNSIAERIEKARQMRYKKPLVKDLNFESILYTLNDISEECADIRYRLDCDGTILNALDGDSDEEYEFKTMFFSLESDCERMYEDLSNKEIPKCFDHFFAAMGAGLDYGGLLGWDDYEQDYYGLENYEQKYAKEKSKKYFEKMTKRNLLDLAEMCFRVYQSFVSLTYRYDCLKASMDILREQNTGHLQAVKEINNIYENASEDDFSEYSQTTKNLDKLLRQLPPEVWLQ